MRFAAHELARKFIFKITIAMKTSLAPCEDTLQLRASQAPNSPESSFWKNFHVTSLHSHRSMTRCNYALRRRPKSPRVLWTDFVILPHRTTAPIYRQDHQTVQTANSLQKLHIKTTRQYYLCLSSGVYALRCARTRPRFDVHNHYRSEHFTLVLRI